MDKILKRSLEEAIWVCKSLFDRCKVSGSSANMSFRIDDKVYITASGSSFGRLTEEDFSFISIDGEQIEGNHLGGKKPSKEYPLHLSFYKKNTNTTAVIHTHSYYSTLWSCLEHENLIDCVPEYTPYLKMKLGTVGIIDYYTPGTEELFAALEERIAYSDGFLLGNHGPIVGGSSIMDAFAIIEELEESCRIAWEFERKSKKLNNIEEL